MASPTNAPTDSALDDLDDDDITLMAPLVNRSAETVQALQDRL